MTQEIKVKQAVFRYCLNSLLIRRLFGLSLCILLHSGAGWAQGVPQIGNRLEFAGVTIHLTEATQHSIQQEAELLYVNRVLVNSRLEKMNLYFPIIRPLLAQQSLSNDFLFLAIQDPIPDVNEPVPGFWALGKTTLGELRIDAFVDERLHPVRSTQAAINRLKKLHQRVPNWVSVLHQYDQLLRGDTAQASAQEAGNEKIYALNDTHDDFLIRLLAAKIVLERALSVYHPQKQTVLFPYEETQGKSLQQIADYCRINVAGIAPYNSWLKAPRIPENEDYTVYVPATLEKYAELKQQTNSSEANQAVLPDAGFPVLQKNAVESAGRGGVLYRINGKKGIQAQLFDSRITLAYEGKVKVEKFQRYNDLRSDRPIVAGEIYYLRKKSKRANVPFHVVRRGQSLWAISQQYGIKLQKLIEYNEVNPEQQPAVARILWLQKKRPVSTPIEYYRSPEQPVQPIPVSATEPVLVAAKLDSIKKPYVPRPEPTVKTERMAVAEKSTHIVPRGSTLAALDSMIALNKSEMPQFRSGATKTIQPTGQKEKVIPAKLVEEEPEEVSGPLIMHTTEKSDTYASVARKYNVTIQQLYIWNNLSAQKPLRPGLTLLIDRSKAPTRTGLVPLASKPTVVQPPVEKLAPAPVVNPAQSSVGSADELIHVVKAGENMYRIGLRYKVKPEQVRQWNNLPNLIAVVGARLVIRKK